MIALAAENHRNPGREAGRCGVMERGNDEQGALPVILQQALRVFFGIHHIQRRERMIVHDFPLKDEFCVSGELFGHVG